MENTRSKADILAEIKKNMEEEIANANKAIKDGNLVAYADATVKLDSLKDEYEKIYSTIVYDELLKLDNSIVEAIKKYSYTTLRYREVKDKESHKVTGLELSEKERQIDLLKFCKYGELETKWQYKVEKFNFLMALRAARELGLTKTDLKNMQDKYYLDKSARDIAMGKTPTSNTQVCKMLQAVIDSIIYEDNGNENNAYKCNNHDVAYLDMCYTKKGRESLSVAMAKNDFLRRLVMDVCHRIICNKKYSAEYKMIKK